MVGTDELMHKAHAMIMSWSQDRDQVAEANAQMICLFEELGEAAEVLGAGPYPLLDELADVIIVANMLSLILTGHGVREPDHYGRTYLRDQTERFHVLVLHIGRAAKVWRHISGQRRRASSKPLTLADLSVSLEQAVRAARRIVIARPASPARPGQPVWAAVPVGAKLVTILERGRGLDRSEITP